MIDSLARKRASMGERSGADWEGEERKAARNGGVDIARRTGGFGSWRWDWRGCGAEEEGEGD